MHKTDLGNFNMDTHAKGITNEASSHPLESVDIKAPSTPQEKLSSMEEAEPVCPLFLLEME